MHSDSKLFNIRITIYSFILTLMVIWVHAVAPSDVADCLQAGKDCISLKAESMLGTGLGQLAVPGFFFMSGYLFFRNMDPHQGIAETADLFRTKLRKRVFSLVLPYIIWNVIYYAVYIAAGRAKIGINELISAVISYRYNPVFWYLQQLILITAAAPLLYVLIRRKTAALAAAVCIFCMAVFWERIPWHYVNEDALCYYTVGALLSLHFGKYEERLDRIGRAGAVCFFICVVCAELAANADSYIYMAAVIGGRLSGLFALFATVSVAVRREVELPSYMKCSFFIYAVHYLVIRMVQSLINILSEAAAGYSLFENDMLRTAVFIVMPLICTAIGYIAVEILRRHMPRLCRLLTGGRAG